MRRAHLLLAFLALLTAAACSPDPDLFDDTRTPGSLRVLHFSYAAPSAFDCFLSACPIDRPVATGGDAWVVIEDGDPARPLTVSSSSPDVAIPRLAAAFTCKSDDDYRPVTSGEPCAKGERREVTYVATVRASAPGPFSLEVRDASNHLVDELPMRADSPVSATLWEGDLARGSHVVVGTGQTRAFRLAVRSATADLMVHDGVSWAFGDADVARAGDPIEDLFGAATDLVVHGEQAGSMQVSLRIGGYEQHFDIDVIQP